MEHWNLGSCGVAWVESRENGLVMAKMDIPGVLSVLLSLGFHFFAMSSLLNSVFSSGWVER